MGTSSVRQNIIGSFNTLKRLSHESIFCEPTAADGALSRIFSRSDFDRAFLEQLGPVCMNFHLKAIVGRVKVEREKHVLSNVNIYIYMRIM